MKTILLTGFEPFGGESVNPAREAAMRLHGRQFNDHVVEARELPTVFGKSIEALLRAIEETRPEAVICLGQAGGRNGISVERVAINVNDAPLADNEGNQPIDTPVAADGPAAYWSTLPVKAIVETLHAASIPAEVSNSAGTFVCNHLFYGMMHVIERSGRKTKGGFIHVPYLPEQAARHSGAPSMPLEQLIQGLEKVIEVVVAPESYQLT